MAVRPWCCLFLGVSPVYVSRTYLNTEKHRPDLKRRRPLVLQDVEADAPELVDVGVVDFC